MSEVTMYFDVQTHLDECFNHRLEVAVARQKDA